MAYPFTPSEQMSPGLTPPLPPRSPGYSPSAQFPPPPPPSPGCNPSAQFPPPPPRSPGYSTSPQFPPPPPQPARHHSSQSFLASPATPSPQLQQAPPKSRVLDIQNFGIPYPYIQISDRQSSTPLYTVTALNRSHFSSDPHLAVQSYATNQIIGTIHFHGAITSDIDLVMYGQRTDLKYHMMKSYYELQSRAPGGTSLKWKNHSMLKGGDLKCTDPAGQTVARFEATTWKGVQKRGLFELGAAVAVDGIALDEMVVSGIAIAEYQRRQEEIGGIVTATGKVVNSAAAGAAGT